MPTLLSHKIELNPNNVQKTFFSRSSGTSKKAYNWGLETWSKTYQAHKVDSSLPKPSGNNLRKAWNKLRKAEFPWSYELPESVGSDALNDLQTAFTNFFEKRAKYPHFKKKGRDHDSFHLDARAIKFSKNHVVLPKIGKVRVQENPRFTGIIQREATISLTFELPQDYKRERTGDGIVGVDLGLTTFATIFDGETFTKVENPRPLRKSLKTLKRAQQSLAKKEKGSKNRKKAVLKVAKIHKRVADVRSYEMHALTSKLCRENQAVGMETLRPSNMKKNRRLSLSISDAAFGEFRRQMEYKAPLYGVYLFKADTFEPSTRRCRKCRVVGPALGLSERVFTCLACGHVEDRDENASGNLHTLVVRGMVSLAREGRIREACGEDVRPIQLAGEAVLDEAGSRCNSGSSEDES